MVEPAQWKFDKKVGQGGFGQVLLWINQATGKKIVIKKCINLLNKTQKKRWNDEVMLMNQIHHPNLVSGIVVPQEIITELNAPELLLGLEFCEQDLRQVLSNVTNRCGLREKMVLGVLKDISSGLDFLHGSNIMHRDLKPENILLKQASNVTIFKITDLGYAKQLDARSIICESFVGTYFYLAPELFVGTYRYTADYWSFGTLLFECIIGTRPFHITDNKGEWPLLIAKKSDLDIWGTFDVEQNNRVIFYKDIPSPNHVCQALLKLLQDFLQLVLRHNPDSRGNKPIYENGPMLWYSTVTTILQTKIILIFDVLTCKNISLIHYGDETIFSIKEYLKNKNIAVEAKDQIFLNTDGQILEDNENIATYFPKDHYKFFIFLFKKNKHHDIQTVLPESARELIGLSGDIKNRQLLQKMWNQSYYHCLKTSQDYSQLINSLQVLLTNIKNNSNNTIKNLQKQITKWSIKLETSIEIYNESCNFDMTKIDSLKCNKEQLNSLSNWKAIEIKIETFMEYLESDNLDTEIEYIVKTFHDISQHQILTDTNNNLKELAKQAEDMLEKYKYYTKDQRVEYTSNMAKVLTTCLKEQDILYKGFYKVLKKSMNCREDMEHITSKLTNRLNTIKENHQQVKKWQLHRQGLLWRLFRASDISNNNSSECILNHLKEIEKKNYFKSPSVSELKQGFTQKMSKLKTILKNEADSPKKSADYKLRKSFTFDGYPYNGDKDVVKISTDQFKRRPSEPANIASSISEKFPFAIKSSLPFKFQDNTMSQTKGNAFQSNLSPINSDENLKNMLELQGSQPKSHKGLTRESQGSHPKSHKLYGQNNSSALSSSHSSQIKYDEKPKHTVPIQTHILTRDISTHSQYPYQSNSSKFTSQPIYKPQQQTSIQSYRVPEHKTHLDSIEIASRQHSSNSNLSTSQKRAEYEKQKERYHETLKHPSAEKQPELRIFERTPQLMNNNPLYHVTPELYHSENMMNQNYLPNHVLPSFTAVPYVTPKFGISSPRNTPSYGNSSQPNTPYGGMSRVSPSQHQYVSQQETFPEYDKFMMPKQNNTGNRLKPFSYGNQNEPIGSLKTSPIDRSTSPSFLYNGGAYAVSPKSSPVNTRRHVMQ